MLTKIRLRNFLSFNSATVIDLKATDYEMLAKINVNNKILKGLLFVGSNASGKTNAISSIIFLLKFLFSDERVEVTDYFCFFSSEDEMFLEYSFLIDNHEIIYSVTFERSGFLKIESLKLNHRELNIDNHLNNKIFLRDLFIYKNFSKDSVLEKLFNFLSNAVYVNAKDFKIEKFNNKNIVSLYDYLNHEGVKAMNDFFELAGYEQEICYESKDNVVTHVYPKLSRAKEIFIKRKNMNLWLPYQYESVGNKTLLNMLPSILHVIKNDTILIIDEFSGSFHNELEELIVRYFMKNARGSQLFLVAHSTNLLSTTLLRPDQIYAANFSDSKDPIEPLGTSLKRFSDEEPRVSQNLEKMYLSGMFDGIPNYKSKQ